MITLSFNVTRDDVLAMASQYYESSESLRKARRSFQIAIPTLLAIIGLLTFFFFQGMKPIGVILLLCSVVAIFVVPRWHRRELRNLAQNMLGEQSYQQVFGKYTLTMTDDGISSVSPIGEGKYAWKAVTRVSLTPEHLFIFLPGNQGFVVPRSQVPETAIQEAKTFLELHIAPKKS